VLGTHAIEALGEAAFGFECLCLRSYLSVKQTAGDLQ